MGNIIVLDDLLDQVKLFSPTGNYIGNYIAEWGDPRLPGAKNMSLDGPIGVARDSQSNIYVTDGNNDRVVKYDAQAQQVATWGGSGAGNGQFSTPNGIAVDASDNIYVADAGNHRIQKFTSSGSFLGSWGSMGNGPGEFDLPNGVAVWGNAVYVADQFNHRIQQFDLDGNYVRQWGSFGTGDGQFNIPAFIAVDSRRLCLCDGLGKQPGPEVQARRKSIWRSLGRLAQATGNWTVHWGSPLTTSGNVIVADSLNARIQIFSPVS